MCDAIRDHRLKIERAKTHIRELETLIKAFIKTDPYSIVVENDLDAEQRVWKIRAARKIPPAWSAVVGDAIHNLRSTLDLLLCAVVRHDDPARQSVNHVHFIVRESKDKFETAITENIKGASSESIRLIHELKPYKGGNEALWRLHKLDIVDKHQRIIPVGAAHRNILLAIRLPQVPNGESGQVMAESNIPAITINTANVQFPLQDGAELFRAPIDGNTRNEDVKFQIDIAFGEGDILDGEPIIPTLWQLTQFVESVCDTFERDILSN